MSLLSLPFHIQENIFSYVSYHDIAKYRLVSRSFNLLSKYLLSKGFLNAQKRHDTAIENIRNRMATITSYEGHPLARRHGILVGLEAHIERLHDVYFNYIKQKMCCFIPGLLLDEIIRVINIVESAENPPPVKELLRDLIYLSSLAIGHFTERIIPHLRRPKITAAAKYSKLMEDMTETSREFGKNINVLLKISNDGKICNCHSKLSVSQRKKMFKSEVMVTAFKKHDILMKRFATLAKRTDVITEKYKNIIIRAAREAGLLKSSARSGSSFHRERIDNCTNNE